MNNYMATFNGEITDTINQLYVEFKADSDKSALKLAHSYINFYNRKNNSAYKFSMVYQMEVQHE